MFGNDQNILANDPGADQTGTSSVFNNVFQQAASAAADVIRAINAPGMAATQQKTATVQANTLLWLFGGGLILWLVFK